jgi:hypothetical protein
LHKEKGGRIAGFIGLLRSLAYELEGEYLRIIALAWQGRESATALLNCTKAFARQADVSSFTPASGNSSEQVHAFYESTDS